MIVVDASLVVKSLFGERDWETAVDFLDRHRSEMAAPDLLLTEVAGAIVRRVNQRDATEDEAQDMLANWLAVFQGGLIALHRLVPELLGGGASLAIDLGHPLPDCLYLALAMDLRCPLVTCDAKFRSKALRAYPDIKLLADFA